MRRIYLGGPVYGVTAPPPPPPPPPAQDPFVIVRTGVGYTSLQLAINAAVAGDTITGVPGTYIVPSSTSVTKNLTIKSASPGQKVRLDANENLGGGGAVLYVNAGITLLLEDFALGNNKFWYTYNSGLGTLGDNCNITCRRCEFHDCCNGVLGANSDTASVWLFENCEFRDNGDDTGLTHGVYLGQAASITFRGCWFHTRKIISDYFVQAFSASAATDLLTITEPRKLDSLGGLLFGTKPRFQSSHIRFANGTPPSPLNTSTTYFAANISGSSFNLMPAYDETPPYTTIDITSDNAGATLGEPWRQPWGHLLKTRAKVTVVEACYFSADVANTKHNRMIDVSNGGNLTVRGCVFDFRSTNTAYNQYIAFGHEMYDPAYNPDGRSHILNIQQNTFVCRVGSSHYPFVLWLNTTAVDPTNGVVISSYSFKDNILDGLVIPSGFTSLIKGDFTNYQISATDNTIGPLNGSNTLLEDITNGDYDPITPVAGAQNWTVYQYAHPTNTSSRSDTYRGARAPADQTQWTYITEPAKGLNPALYKGNQTFNTVATAYGDIPSAGGWRTLDSAYGVDTRLLPKYMTSEQLDAIAPVGAMRQKSRTSSPGNAGDINTWQAAAWNGYGWWYLPAGGHFVSHRNDMYLLRIADPVGAFRIHDTAPLAGAHIRAGGTGVRGLPVNTLEDPQYWNLYSGSGEGLRGISLWGPQSEHQYDGLEWCASTERLVFGGDNPQILLNPEALGSLYVGQTAISIFNPYAPTPKSAWTKTTIGSSATAGPSLSAYGMVDNGDNTVSFVLTNANRGRYTINTQTGVVTSGAPGAGPSDYNEFTTCFRDPATNKYYEFYRLGAANNPRPSIYTLTGGRTLLAGNLMFYVGSANYNDADPAVVVVNSKAYIFGFPAVDLGGGLYGTTANESTKRVQVQVAQVDLSNGNVNYFNDGTQVEMLSPSAGTVWPGGGNNGHYGQFAYIPSVGAFVAMFSPTSPAIVFRPPSSWTI